MNKVRRKEVAKAQDLIEQARSILEGAASEEREYFDNMPENMQGSERGMGAEATADMLEEAVGEIDTMMSNLEAAMA